MWKCRTVENEENQNQVSLVFHRPWKSLRDSHIPTTPTTILPFPNQNQKTRKEPQLRRKPQPPSSGSSFDEKMLDQTKYYDQISFRVRQNELRFVDSKRNKGVFQFFNSIYREDDFPSYKSDLKKVVEAKINKIESEIDGLKKKIEKTTSEKQKKKHNASINSKKKAIADWKKHLTNDEKLKGYYLKDWRTFHGSDHLPLWVELEIDFSDEYLEKLAQP